MIWAVATTLIGGLAITTVFDQIADRRFNEGLRDSHTEVVVALANTLSPDSVQSVLKDPAYERAYSGRYWQLVSKDGTSYTSPSLFDAELPRPPIQFEGEHFWESNGPYGSVRGIREHLILSDGSEWTVSVAGGLATLAMERAEMQRSVAATFGLVALLGIAGAVLLTTILVAPLRKLRDDVRRRWETERALVADQYPKEVIPLVEDINELMSRNREILSRGRRQAADLAHALKTPSAAMRNQVTLLSDKTDGTEPLFEALDRMDMQISRSLARMRTANAEDSIHVRTDLEDAIGRIERLFRSLPDSEVTDFHVATESAVIAADPQDIEEILGNLLENAFKWSKSAVRLSVENEGEVVVICVEDDGPGIPEHQRSVVLGAGARLDTSMPGTGIGLSITNDLVGAYGGELVLTQSTTLGGLCCRAIFPIAAKRNRPVSALTH